MTVKSEGGSSDKTQTVSGTPILAIRKCKSFCLEFSLWQMNLAQPYGGAGRLLLARSGRARQVRYERKADIFNLDKGTTYAPA